MERRNGGLHEGKKEGKDEVSEKKKEGSTSEN